MINSVKNISFKAVNPEYLNFAKEEFAVMKTVSGDLIESLQYDVLTKKISPKDGIDTVNEIRQFTKSKYHCFLDSLVEMCEYMLKRKK